MKKWLAYLCVFAMVLGLLGGCQPASTDESGSAESAEVIQETQAAEEETPEETEATSQSEGVVTLRVEGYDSSVVPETQVEITEPFSLVERGYVDVEPETYTALHAIVSVLEENGLEFEAESGFIYNVDAGIDSTEHGDYAGWMFSYNDTMPSTAANEIQVQDGDMIILYYCAYFDGMYHAFFQDGTIEAKAGEEITLDLIAASVDYSQEDYGVYGPFEGASIYADGDVVGTTDERGQITVTFDQAGTYTITALYYNEDGINLLTYACCTIIVE